MSQDSPSIKFPRLWKFHLPLNFPAFLQGRVTRPCPPYGSLDSSKFFTSKLLQAHAPPPIMWLHPYSSHSRHISSWWQTFTPVSHLWLFQTQFSTFLVWMNREHILIFHADKFVRGENPTMRQMIVNVNNGVHYMGFWIRLHHFEAFYGGQWCLVFLCDLCHWSYQLPLPSGNDV